MFPKWSNAHNQTSLNVSQMNLCTLLNLFIQCFRDGRMHTIELVHSMFPTWMYAHY
jgi:hypothetical protein